MELEIKKYDHHGRGIAHHGDKIIFVENAMPGEIVEVEETKQTSKWTEAKVIDYKVKSPQRVKSKCPFYDRCGDLNQQ